MVSSIKIIYRYLYKRYLIVSYAFFLIVIVIVIWGTFAQYILHKYKKNVNNTLFIEDKESCQSFLVSFNNHGHKCDPVIYSIILKNNLV